MSPHSSLASKSLFYFPSSWKTKNNWTPCHFCNSDEMKWQVFGNECWTPWTLLCLTVSNEVSSLGLAESQILPCFGLCFLFWFLRIPSILFVFVFFRLNGVFIQSALKTRLGWISLYFFVFLSNEGKIIYCNGESAETKNGEGRSIDSRFHMPVATACKAFSIQSYQNLYFVKCFFVIHQVHRESFIEHGKPMILASLFADNYIIIKYGDRKWIPISKGKPVLYDCRSYCDSVSC